MHGTQRPRALRPPSALSSDAASLMKNLPLQLDARDPPSLAYVKAYMFFHPAAWRHCYDRIRAKTIGLVDV